VALANSDSRQRWSRCRRADRDRLVQVINFVGVRTMHGASSRRGPRRRSSTSTICASGPCSIRVHASAWPMPARCAG